MVLSKVPNTFKAVEIILSMDSKLIFKMWERLSAILAKIKTTWLGSSSWDQVKMNLMSGATVRLAPIKQLIWEMAWRFQIKEQQGLEVQGTTIHCNSSTISSIQAPLIILLSGDKEEISPDQTLWISKIHTNSNSWETLTQTALIECIRRINSQTEIKWRKREVVDPKAIWTANARMVQACANLL